MHFLLCFFCIVPHLSLFSRRDTYDAVMLLINVINYLSACARSLKRLRYLIVCMSFIGNYQPPVWDKIYHFSRVRFITFDRRVGGHSLTRFWNCLCFFDRVCLSHSSNCESENPRSYCFLREFFGFMIQIRGR